MLLYKPATQISYDERHETNDSTPEIKVYTSAIGESPLYPRKQLKCFGDMSKNDHYQISRTE
jgi:hypothetical protein